ncbi:sigma-54-dependent transcriptional regulator [Ostreibacterium oceani]|uniref:Response regulator n=1 Tax=Ostreibacterium oceani TaxID=2654998 RepID=A0A6N7ES12_9GAMM|nr:sigma-54 dependent transcriptional regulator [Ostreibacterium oceani]MPV85331.1 response regulator [Ostreibacterium oceani]
MNLQPTTILIIDDEPDICELLKDILEDEGYAVITAANANQADEIYQNINQPIDIALLDIWMPDEDGISLLKRWQEKTLRCEIIMMSGHGTIETAVQATKHGAFDFVEKPISTAKLLITLENAAKKIKLEKKNAALLSTINPPIKIVGKSDSIKEIKNQLELLKTNELPVSFWGKSGTGKQFYSRYLHQITPDKASEPFISVNAAALSRTNQLVEIFGSGETQGLIQQAGSGTLYIDEMMDLTPETQALFTQLIEEKTVKRPQSKVNEPITARLCFGSQYHPDTLIEQGSIKPDFYYQIKSIAIFLPNLQTYQDDIPELINHFIYEFVDQEDLPFRQFTMQALNFLRQCPWTGNVRELKNFVQRALVLAESDEIDVETVQSLMQINHQASLDSDDSIPIDLPIREAREQFERAYFIKQLAHCEGNVAKLAERSGLERTNLYRKLKSLDIQYK